jgi:5S rRNA maturation endonuclease (ribonuclease M5)
MRIRGQEITVDVKTELENFDWQRPNWTSNKLIASSPFKLDHHPSFFCRLIAEDGYDEGVWGDSSAIDDEYASGSFAQLLAFLRNESVEESEDYLLTVYGGDVGYQKLTLSLDFVEEGKHHFLDNTLLEENIFDPTYLSSRGVSESVQSLCQIRYNEKTDCILIPWFDVNGNFANCKYRKTKTKQFWYAKNGIPIRDMIWGLNIINKRRCDYAVITEAEIDSMTLMTHGIPSIAIGGASLSNRKAELLIKSPVERFYIATDNDETGNKIKRQLIQKLSLYKTLYSTTIPKPYKDMNDVRNKEEIKKIITSSKKVEKISF